MSIGDSIKNAATDLLTNSDFISRTIGMNNSYEDIMFIVQALGREPVSLLGKNYAFIFDHVRRNFQQGVSVPSTINEGCPKFTFYKEVPTVRFADPYHDPLRLLDRWIPNMKFEDTSITNEQIRQIFSPEIAKLVDGVTKIKDLEFKRTEKVEDVLKPGDMTWVKVMNIGPRGIDLSRKDALRERGEA